MIFEYAVQKTFNESLDVVDAGNCTLRCTGGKMGAFNYYIIIKTVMGKTHIIKFGPILPDIPMLVENFNITYTKNDYKESFIFKEVDKFINDFRKEINSVEEITEYEAWQDFPPIQQYFENI